MNNGQIAFGSVLILAGAIMVGVSIWQLTKLYNQYEITYTDIPDNMVDVVSHENGDRFVNYKNVLDSTRLKLPFGVKYSAP
jgi:hypothetical protein